MYKRLVLIGRSGGPFTGIAFLPFVKATDGAEEDAGVKRLRAIFERSSTGTVAPEIGRVTQTAFAGFMLGSIYGGFKMMKENTKRGVIGGVRRAGMIWGLKAAFLTSTYVTIITGVATYRNEPSVYEYIAAGATCGAMYSYNRGLKRIAIAFIYGSIMGYAAGAWTLLMSNMQDMVPIVTPPNARNVNEVGASGSSEVAPAHASPQLVNATVAKSSAPSAGTAVSWAALDDVERKLKAKSS